LDYAEYTWSTDGLREIALETDGNAYLNINTSVGRMKRELGGAAYWVGFLGEASAGDQLPPAKAFDPVEWFLAWNPPPGASRRLAARLAPELRWHLPLERGEPRLAQAGAAESINFYNRHERRAANQILPRSLDIRTPFVRPEWTSFILRAPRPYREGRMLQREMLKRFYPRLARIPSSSLHGHAVLGSTRSNLQPIPRPWHYARMAAYVLGFPEPTNPRTVHTDRENVRTREDLRSAIDELIEAAADRPFLDGRRVRRLWRNFLARREIRVHKVDRLAALEANLQAHGL
jgi:hypothetical protein